MFTDFTSSSLNALFPFVLIFLAFLRNSLASKRRVGFFPSVFVMLTDSFSQLVYDWMKRITICQEFEPTEPDKQ